MPQWHTMHMCMQSKNLRGTIQSNAIHFSESDPGLHFLGALLLLGPDDCDKRGGRIAAELAQLTSARVARLCAQSRSPRTTETSHEAGERLEPAASFGRGTRGRVDGGSWEGSNVRGIVADGIGTSADGKQSGRVRVLWPLLGA